MMIRVPVMFLVEVGSVITTVDFIGRPSVFVGLVAAWLWATVLFANFAEAVAEGRGKAQADTLRRSRRETVAYRLTERGMIETVASTGLTVGDRCVVTANQVIPATATSSRASPSSTSRPSPASRPRSSASPEATARR